MVVRTYNATQQTRTGVLTEVFEDIEYSSDGFRSIAKTAIPYARSKTISFEAKSLKPFTKLYVFFDKQLVNKYVTPGASGAVGTTFSNFSDVETPVAGSTLISDGVGNCEGTFTIPNPRVDGNPKFATGDIDFVITADPNNKQVGDGANEIVARETYAEAIYSARGILDTQQETIIATRNAIVSTTDLFEEGEVIVGSEYTPPRMDPLAQTFIVLDTDVQNDNVSGSFVTSCDVFFFAKDNTYPVTMEIRNVINGVPGPKILPFGRKTLQSSEVTTSTDGNTATTFTFDSPVYMQGGTEYSICLLANTPEYKVWIADLGTQDTSGNEITDQPHVGVLFKSSNNSTWVPSPTQDMKFSLKRAKFDTNAAGLVTLQNKTLPVKTLNPNPLEMTDNSTTLKIIMLVMVCILLQITSLLMKLSLVHQQHLMVQFLAPQHRLPLRVEQTLMTLVVSILEMHPTCTILKLMMRLLVILIFLEQVSLVQHGAQIVQLLHLMRMAQL